MQLLKKKCFAKSSYLDSRLQEADSFSL